MPYKSLTFTKQERLCSRTLIEKLFNGGGSRSMAAFPLRLVYMAVDLADGEPPVRVMVSVSKRHFKRAVKRNRVKRQVREAYRKHKSGLWERLAESEGKGFVAAFIWLDDKLWSSDKVEAKVKNLLDRLTEKADRL